MKRYKKLEVTWLDAGSVDGWDTLRSHKKRAMHDFNCPVVTVGYLVKKTKRVLLVAQSLTKDRGTRAWSVFYIPRGMIKRVRVL